MSDIQSLIQKLQSNNPEKRYEACEELRVMMLHQPLLQDAIDALNIAANDADPNVADAARRALVLHSEKKNEELERGKNEEITNSVKYWPLIGLLGGIVSGLLLAFVEYIFDLYVTFYCVSLAIPFTLIGAYIGRRNYKTAWIGSIVGAILGVGFIFVLLLALDYIISF